MQREVPEVCRDVIRQFTEEAHDHRGAGVVRRRVDAALSEAKHGGQGRRGWRKLHLGVDGSRVIVACALTAPTAEDAMTGISLVDEVDGHLTRVTADPAYDTLAC